MRKIKIKNKKIIPLLEEAVALLKITKSVKKIALFGSQARGDNRENSDIDLAVWGKIKTYDCETLKERLKTLPTLRTVDLVHYEYARDYMKESINQEKIILYERR